MPRRRSIAYAGLGASVATFVQAALIHTIEAPLVAVLLLGQAGLAAAGFGLARAGRVQSRETSRELSELRIHIERVEASVTRLGGRLGSRPLAESCWGVEDLRDLIDGNGAIPSGLDADAIAAARRISRALNGVTPGNQARV